jgi:hypothetical protein
MKLKLKGIKPHGEEDIEEQEGIEDDLYGEEGPAPGLGVRAPDWTVQVTRADRSAFEFYRQRNMGRLEFPDFQRDFVWKLAAQVRLIESLLARIPLPAIYLSDESEEKSIVVDGKQRLTTIFRFLDGEFRLKGLKLLPRFENKTFKELEPRFQRRIEDTMLTVFSIQAGADPQVKFYLFERINQGGVALNAQEIRNGIYRGPGLTLVQRLAAEGGPFRKVAGEHRNYQRMRADELVLRCFAFLLLDLDAYPGDMEPYLNDALMELNRMDADRLAEIEGSFLSSLAKVEAVFGLSSFKRHDVEQGSWGRHLNAAIMDLQMWGFRQVPRPRDFWEARKDRVLAALQDLHRIPEFRDAITYATSVTARVKYRLETWKEALEHVARNHP